MKKFYSLVLFLSLTGMNFAQTVSQQEAAVVAQRFFESQGMTFVRCSKVVENEQGALLYFFNAENGFVVIAGDKNVQPVLSFSDGQIYNDNDVVPPFEMWINHYANQIDQIKKLNIVQPQFASQWEELLSDSRGFRTGDEVEPLLHSKWDQGDYYNYYCPHDPAGQNGRAVTGCVATAMGQLIYYFRFPEHGTGSYSYTDEHYGVQSADYENVTYDYNAMCDVPTAINPEISKLIYHCGVGVDMHYGPDGSGMTNHSAAKVLRTHFKFSPETEYLFRDSTDLNWDSVIVSHLSRKIPMYYAGWSVPDINGHGFICDGYKTVDSAYYFHFNFGWSGYMDNYYYTNSLYVGGSNFNLAQELIINGYPDTTQYTYPTPQPLTGSITLTADEGTFTDGSRPEAHCPAGMNFAWNIQPETSNLTDVSLTVNYELAAGDTLFVTNPNVNTFEMRTADTGTMTVAWGTTELTVHLFTHTSESGGFRASYTSHQPTFCSKTKTFSSITGHIEDGSGSNNYNNLNTCKFKIVLGGQNNAILIHINSLDLEDSKDFLSFYDNNISDTTHFLTLTGQKTDTTAIFDTRRLLIVFETDETGTANGFDLDYEGGHVGISELADDELRVYPNPATSMVTLESPTPVSRVEIRDAEGRTVYTGVPDSESFSIPVNRLSSGIYILTAHIGDRTVTHKFVKL